MPSDEILAGLFGHNMVLPWALNDRTDRNRWQHHAAWLGRAYNPIIPRFAGKGCGTPRIGKHQQSRVASSSHCETWAVYSRQWPRLIFR